MNKQMKGPLIRILLIVAAVIAAYCLWCHFLSDDVIWKKIDVYKRQAVSLQPENHWQDFRSFPCFFMTEVCTNFTGVWYRAV